MEDKELVVFEICEFECQEEPLLHGNFGKIGSLFLRFKEQNEEYLN